MHSDHAPPHGRPPEETSSSGGHGDAPHGEHGKHDAHGGGHGSHGGGHDAHEGHSPDMFRDRFWFSLILTVPVLVWAEHVQMVLGFDAPTFPGSVWIGPVLGTVLFVYGGSVFLKGALGELKDRRPGMMTLISLAISVAFVFSWVVTLGWIRAEVLWWELATLVTIMLLGHWIEMRSIDQAQGALKELARLVPDTAVRITGAGEEEEVPVAHLRAGDLVLVRPGAGIPADGVVRRGRSDVVEAMITGESAPVKKEEGAEVTAGTLNGDGSLRVEVTEVGERTRLSGIMRLVADAQRSRSRMQHLADRAARLLTAVALAAAVLTFIGWTLAGSPIDQAIVRTVTVLVIACPHALGLAVPLVVAISTRLAAGQGLLIRDRRGLEEARSLQTVVFDKTGTLTLGEMRVIRLVTADDGDSDLLLGIAAAVEADSEHPIARAVMASARDREIEVPTATGFRALPGRGVSATVDGREYAVGGPALLDERGATHPPAFQDALLGAERDGRAVITLLEGDEARALLVVADAVKPESHAAVAALKARGIEVVMLTGDAGAVAEAVAAELGIDRVMAEVLPGDKADRVRSLQEGGRRVAMVGDGVNDAPALATADIGIAIGAGTQVAVQAGHVILMRSDPGDIPRLIDLSRATYRKMVQNLWAAAGYNIVAIPVAAGVLAPWGILLSPAMGALLMSTSTVVVAANAQLLRRVRL